MEEKALQCEGLIRCFDEDLDIAPRLPPERFERDFSVSVWKKEVAFADEIFI